MEQFGYVFWCICYCFPILSKTAICKYSKSFLLLYLFCVSFFVYLFLHLCHQCCLLINHPIITAVVLDFCVNVTTVTLFKHLLYFIFIRIFYYKKKYKQNWTSKPILNIQHCLFTADMCMCGNYSVPNVFKIQFNSESLNMHQRLNRDNTKRVLKWGCNIIHKYLCLLTNSIKEKPL